MENKKIMAFVLTGALASGTIGAGSTVYAVNDSTDYVLTIPATLAVENAGWNATEGITAKVKDGDTFDSNKKLTVTASSGDAFALVSGENTISYSLATEENGAANTTWEFSAAELNETNGTTKSMGINIENYSTKPAGNYQDTVTFTAEVKNAVIPVSSVTLSQSTLELTAGGDSSTLTASVLPINATNKTITWNSSNPSVATVVDGVVTPVSEGTATITATVGDKSTECSVTVEAAALGVTWNYATFRAMNSGDTKNGITFTTNARKISGNLYSGTHTFTATGHKIKKIEFATTSTNMSSSSFSSGSATVENYTFNSTQDGGSVNGKKITWTGDAESVSMNGNAYAIEYVIITVE